MVPLHSELQTFANNEPCDSHCQLQQRIFYIQFVINEKAEDACSVVSSFREHIKLNAVGEVLCIID